ncbi:MAG: DNA repair protein RecO [Clostridiales bacterium]|nr:DNA repair protein RecO [Clostridiales bacterium]
MASLTIQGIVLRRADYKENDRMLTLLTPLGKKDALCRGCKRPTSPLLNAAECFAMGEYVLYSGQGRATVTSCQLNETFYPLRGDYDRLRAGAYMLNLCDATAQEGEKCPEMFTLLARSLFRLAYTQRNIDVIVAGFLLHFAAVNGYMPRLGHCVSCGAEVTDPRLFDPENGGVLCPACSTSFTVAAPLRPGQKQWMEQVLRVGIDKYPAADEDPPVELLKKYIALRIERNIKY